MKKFIMVSLILAGAAVAAKAQPDTTRAEQLRAADAIHARVVDTEAMSWAWRIEKGRGLSYAALAKQSANWERGEEVRSTLLSKVKEILNNGETRLLTVKEERELSAAETEVRSLLSGTRGPSAKSAGRRAARQSAIDAAAREMLDAESKYWAWRIAVKRDITYKELKSYSDGWLRGPEVSGALLEKVTSRLQSGETPALSGADQEKLDAGNRKIKEIVSRA